MTAMTTRPTSSAAPGRPSRSRLTSERARILPTILLLIGGVYCLIPVAWVFVASSKAPGELFNSFTFAPGSGLLGNLTDLFAYNDGVYGLWAMNSLLYAGVGGVLSTLVSAAAGYALAKFDFPGGRIFFGALLAGLLIPGITLAVPQYMLLSELGLAGTRWSVLLPSIISPFGIYLCKVFAEGAIAQEALEAARIDGANEWRIFSEIVLPLMVPGMVTVFLLQFVGIWNNFLLPYIMLADSTTFPLTVGLSSLLSQGSGSPALYSLSIIGAAVAIVPLIALVLFLQRFWRLDLISGGVKG
ncbi:carbohydrate ABC transporter membrane protein 2, CUT1 family [Rathayibacter oskolensis]|uniref:Carbohydrate ABC transporter membrane protein 2, CUT1 family n=1 Tax=Rathayibacter oskolensis TaxID=1891671 RepID=A0A1X7N823_9MICO|nr:carbohydrate ABC transporter permease [Rathayibacter oskolensis]SMH33617.1 carbohydrate ABC transporter membrane protein 2, CUT1 family [Rathayibacter oskolensis]